MADVTIQPDPSFGENKCIVYRGASTQDLFRVQSTATLTLKNLILDGRTEEDGNIINRVQARMIWSFGNVNLDNCEFRYAYNLNGPAKGGVIRMEQDNNRELIISDCYFHDNVVEGGSANGAAISAEYCKTTITSSKFENNTVKSLDSSGGGGAIYVYGRFRTAPGSQQYVPNLILADVELIENRVTANATTDLDKLKVGGGGIYVTEHAWVTLDGCTITGNSAPTGGGIFYNFGIVDIADIADTDITGNTADKIGGGIFFNNSVDAKRFSVRGRVVIDGNTATNPQIIGAGTPYPSTVDINFGNNVMLYNSTNDAPQSISVVGNLTDGSSIGITAIDSNNQTTKDRMKSGGQFGKALGSGILNVPVPQSLGDYVTGIENGYLMDASQYSGLNCFFRDTNGYAEDDSYLYGEAGTNTSALYQKRAIVWKKGSAPVNDVDFEFTKTDEQGSPFGQNEATFEIMNPDTSSGFTKVYASTDANGKVTFTGLPVNTTYRIYETKTKLHYSLPLGYWELTVADDGTFTLKAVSQGGYMPEFAVTDNGGTKTYSLINHPQFQLPLTGGDGTAKIIVIGIVVLCTPILIKLKSFRKKEKSL